MTHTWRKHFLESAYPISIQLWRPSLRMREERTNAATSETSTQRKRRQRLPISIELLSYLWRKSLIRQDCPSVLGSRLLSIKSTSKKRALPFLASPNAVILLLNDVLFDLVYIWHLSAFTVQKRMVSSPSKPFSSSSLDHLQFRWRKRERKWVGEVARSSETRILKYLISNSNPIKQLLLNSIYFFLFSISQFILQQLHFCFSFFV